MRNARKTQALLFVTFLMFLVSTIASSVSPLLVRDIMMRSTHEYGNAAFYLALTAFEKAKTECLYNNWSAGTYNRPDRTLHPSDPKTFWYYAPGGRECKATDWFCDLSWPDDLMFRYQFTIVNPGGARAYERDITAVGEVIGSYYGTPLARKVIKATIIGITDGTVTPCGCTLTNPGGKCTSWSCGAGTQTCLQEDFWEGDPLNTLCGNNCTWLAGGACQVVVDPAGANGVDDDLRGALKLNSWREE